MEGARAGIEHLDAVLATWLGSRCDQACNVSRRGGGEGLQAMAKKAVKKSHASPPQQDQAAGGNKEGSRPATLASSPHPAVSSAKSQGGLASYCNTSTLAVVLLASYVFYVSMSLRRIMNPYVPPVEADTPSLDPLWEEGRPFEVSCYISTMADVIPSGQSPIWRATSLDYTWSAAADGPNRPLTLLAPDADAGNSSSSNETVELGEWFWSAVRRGEEAYLHVYVTRPGGSLDPNEPGFDRLSTLHGVVPMVKREYRKPTRAKHRLLEGVVVKEPEILMDGDQGLYWKPEVAVRLVTDFTRYPLDGVPVQIANHLEVVDLVNNGSPDDPANWRRRRTNMDRYKYLPPMHVDEIGLTSDKWVGLNSTVSRLPLRISYSPLSLQRWQLTGVLEESLRTQKGLGLDDKDIDDVRRLITDTNVILLGVTVLASVLHLLFEFLAFQSDIMFWRKNKSLRGLSVRSVVIELVCQTIILFFLIDTDTSLLVVVPSAVGIVIQLWKVQRATGIALVRDDKGGGRLRIALVRLEEEAAKASSHKASSSPPTSTPSEGGAGGMSPSAAVIEAKEPGVEVETMQLDRMAIIHLSLVLAPAVLGFAIKSLLHEEHTSWYSWFISTLTGAVYAFGFILMTPQLYINYRLKSVSHLPWRFLCYRFINTFIDDLFAFIIKMPTMHRLSCFRDDVVFIIYLYQRWIYKVDERRTTDAEDCPGS